MTIQTITLPLSDLVMRRAALAANALHRPLEDVLVATLMAALPDVDDAPPHLQAELTNMTWLSDQELWTVARNTMSDDQQGQLTQIIDLQSHRLLSDEEAELLEVLRQEYGRVTLRKARAYALLSLRGGRPLLSDN